MSRTRKRVMVACVVVMVCGVIAFALLRRPAAGLTLSFQGYEPDPLGRVIANILVSNGGPHDLYVTVRSKPAAVSLLPSHPDDGAALAHEQAAILAIEIPAKRPCRVVAECIADYSVKSARSLSDRLRYYLATHISETFWPQHTVTLDIPE